MYSNTQMYPPKNLSYTVALQDCRDLPESVRTDAEVRFARELEAVLGGPDFVAETYSAWLDLREAEARSNKDTAVTAARWPVAISAANHAALSALGSVGVAHFEVRLRRDARAA